MIRLALIAGLLGLSQCGADETVAGYGGAGRVWTLTELNGAPFDARATLTFPEDGKISGQAACNGFSGPMTAPYPWFEVGDMIVTRMACPDLDKETAYLQALGQATQSEVADDTLILSNDDGLEMVFKAFE